MSQDLTDAGRKLVITLVDEIILNIVPTCIAPIMTRTRTTELAEDIAPKINLRKTLYLPLISKYSRSKSNLAFALQTSAAYSTCLPSLALSLDHQPKAANGVPIMVEACLRYFSTSATNCKDLFRIPGNSNHVCKMWDYMEDHPFARLSMNCVEKFMRKHPTFSAYDVASFLKRFLAEITGDEPVVTYNCHEPLVDLIRTKCPTRFVGEKFRRIIGQLLVPVRRLLLERLCTFLLDFSKHESTTKMNCTNLAVCFANLMLPAPEDFAQPSHQHVKKLRSIKKANSINQKLPVHNKIKRTLTVEDIRDLVKTEGEKAKWCVAVIKSLIQQSDHVFTESLSPKCIHTKPLPIIFM